MHCSGGLLALLLLIGLVLALEVEEQAGGVQILLLVHVHGPGANRGPGNCGSRHRLGSDSSQGEGTVVCGVLAAMRGGETQFWICGVPSHPLAPVDGFRISCGLMPMPWSATPAAVTKAAVGIGP